MSLERLDLARLRQEIGLTQRALAERLDIPGHVLCRLERALSTGVIPRAIEILEEERVSRNLVNVSWRVDFAISELTQRDWTSRRSRLVDEGADFLRRVEEDEGIEVPAMVPPRRGRARKDGAE